MHLNIEAAWARLQGMLQGLITAIPNLVIGAGLFVLFMVAARLTRGAVCALTGPSCCRRTASRAGGEGEGRAPAAGPGKGARRGQMSESCYLRGRYCDG